MIDLVDSPWTSTYILLDILFYSSVASFLLFSSWDSLIVISPEFLRKQSLELITPEQFPAVRDGISEQEARAGGTGLKPGAIEMILLESGQCPCRTNH